MHRRLSWSKAKHSSVPGVVGTWITVDVDGRQMSYRVAQQDCWSVIVHHNEYFTLMVFCDRICRISYSIAKAKYHTGVSATGELGNPFVWSLIDESQTPNYSDITDTQDSNFSDITETQTPNWEDVA